jgi:hypothetical protein
VTFVCAVLFTIIWWQKEHHGSNWLPLLVVLIALCAVVAFYAFRGLRRSLAGLARKRGTRPASANSNSR